MICKRKPSYAKHTHEQLLELDPEEYLENSTIYSKSLKWVALSGQQEMFKDAPVKPLYDNILVAKLRENQEIEVEIYCSKNIGRVHAKWSPVSTAYYRLLPSIGFNGPIEGEDAAELVGLCPQGVFKLKKSGKKQVIDIEDVKACTMCRECIRGDKFNGLIELGKEKKRYIFTVESVGVVPPERLFLQSLEILKGKVAHYLKHLQGLKKSGSS